jgi:hypothetical protein
MTFYDELNIRNVIKGGFVEIMFHKFTNKIYVIKIQIQNLFLRTPFLQSILNFGELNQL